MDDSELLRLINDHLCAPEPECRWCFAIDQVRIPGREVGMHSYPDVLMLVLECSRCGGVFTYCAEVVGRDYLEERFKKLHPDDHELDEARLKEIVDLTFPAFSKVWREHEQQ